MRKYIPFHVTEGTTSRQAHTNLPAGTFEREISKEGFFGPAAHVYHAHPPTGWESWEGALRPRAFDLNRLQASADCPWATPVVLHNANCRIRWWRCAKPMDHLVRNGDGDELLFIHRGQGDFYCDFGHLPYRTGDYIVVPRGTMWRMTPTQESILLMVEATNASYQLPERGLLGPHAIFDPAMLDRPALNEIYEQQKSEEPWRVAVQRRGAVSTVSFPFNPLDTVGWKGDLSVVRINIENLRPVMSHRYHLPPSAHTTFLGNRFVVCTFTPRPFESAPEALKVPFFHNNDDYDEVIFYHAGDFFSRDNIDAGMMTFHPCGFTHGPHPKALKNAFSPSKSATDEYAVMIDTRDALEVGAAAQSVESEDYVNSWKGG